MGVDQADEDSPSVLYAGRVSVRRGMYVHFESCVHARHCCNENPDNRYT